jgi:large subunit ribosomal protein L25
MAQQVSEIKAEPRARGGTGGARAIRREDKVPGVVYGDGREPENISVNGRELNIIIGRGKFLSTVFELDVGGKKSRVIPREVQLDPVKDWPIHVDFQRVGAGARIRVNVPVRFINEGLSPGLKRGGVLNIVRHEVEVTCPADAIPDFFEFNLEGLEIGRSVHISATKLPDGVKPTILNRDFTVATIAGHKIEEEPTPGAEVAAVEGAVPAEGEAAAAEGAAPADAKAAGKEAAGGKAPAGKEAAGGKAPAGKEAAGAKPAAGKAPDKGKK